MTNEPRPNSDDFKDSKTRTFTEEVELAADQLVEKVKELTHEGNVRTIRLKREGKVLVELPLTIAAVGGVLTTLIAPQLAILGAIAGVVTHCTVEIERIQDAAVKPKNEDLIQK